MFCWFPPPSSSPPQNYISLKSIRDVNPHFYISSLRIHFTSVPTNKLLNSCQDYCEPAVKMDVKTAIILLASIIVVMGEAPSDFQVDGNSHSHGSGPPPSFQSGQPPNYASLQHGPPPGHLYNRPPLRVRQTGASKLFEWIGSRFAKIPYFLPRVPQFPKYNHAPHGSQPQYQSIIIPQPQQQSQSHGVNPQQNYNIIEENYPTDGSYTPDPSVNEIPEDIKAPTPQNNYEVVPSQLLSYEKEVIPMESGWQPGFGGIPLASPPLHHNQGQGQSQVPAVPQSMGPDYFNTAYNSQENKDQYQQQQSQSSPQNYQAQAQNLHQQYQTPDAQSGQSYSAANNYGATFLDIQPQLGFVSPTPDSSGQYSGQTASFDLNQADFTTLLSSMHNGGGSGFIGNDGFNVQGSHIVPVATNPPKLNQGSQSQKGKKDGFIPSGIPGVQILSQTDDGGNPVFEVLADADAPSFGGHPFDINKLISMIEPGAELVDAPQLSQAASETKNVYAAAPGSTAAAEATTASGISDLSLSKSQPSPSRLSPDTGKNKKIATFFSTKNDSDPSSLKEIMDFFQQTGGKGYVVVEKKRTAPDNLTDALSPDDGLTDGFSRLNITSETLPLLQLDKPKYNYSIPPRAATRVKFTPNPRPTKLYSFKPFGPRKPFRPAKTTTSTVNIPVQFSNLTSPTVFFAVRATTQHPNHNYNASSSDGPTIVFPVPTVNTLLDSVQGRPDAVTINPETDDDLSVAESGQVKSIAITVTPPPHLTSSSTTPTPTIVPVPNQLVPVTKKSVSSSTSSKKRPAPVYRRKPSQT